MNRAQRRNANTPKSNVRKAGLTYLTVAGVVSGSLGVATAVQAAPALITNCAELETELTNAFTLGGNIVANFSGTCDFAEGFIFQGETTITGPTTGTLTLRFTGDANSEVRTGGGFTARADLSISNLNFTRPLNSVGFDSFIYGNNQSNYSLNLSVSNTTFSNADVSAAIYVEGNLIVSDSSFTNLVSPDGGAAIWSESGSTITVSDSVFASNQVILQGSGGAVNSFGSLSVTNSTFSSNTTSSFGGAIFTPGTLNVSNSTFDSNESANEGGAIYAPAPGLINNSTFVGNSAASSAAFSMAEGAVISNNTFWNNGDVDTYSFLTDSSYFFGNILANDAPNTVKLIDPSYSNIDLGANLYTDTSFTASTTGEGSSKLVTPDELNLRALTLNQTLPTNTGTTETVAIGADSVAYDFYSADSSGIDPTANGGLISTLMSETDQRGAFRPFGDGYDVGAFELGASQIVEPEVTEKETLADTGIDTQANYLGLVGLGLAAVLGGSAGILRRRKQV